MKKVSTSSQGNTHLTLQPLLTPVLQLQKGRAARNLSLLQGRGVAETECECLQLLKSNDAELRFQESSPELLFALFWLHVLLLCW